MSPPRRPETETSNGWTGAEPTAARAAHEQVGGAEKQGEEFARHLRKPPPFRALRFDGRARSHGSFGGSVSVGGNARHRSVHLGAAASGPAEERAQGAAASGADERRGTRSGGPAEV